MAALYRLQLPSAGTLRMAILAWEDRGRLTISEPLGSTVSITAWEGRETPEIFDMRHGCKISRAAIREEMGMAGFPARRLVRLLAGRLPDLPGDRIAIDGGDSVRIISPGWQARIVLAADPWRIIRIEGEDWEVTLDDHTSSLPGRLVIHDKEGRWARLELRRLKWEISREPGVLPDLPICTGG